MGAGHTESEQRREQRPIWRRVLDSVFGYDFFISYKWNDGRRYAGALAQKLEERGFEVFLDSEDYAKGDDWQEIGKWTLRRTGQLILIGTKEALLTREKETPVEREVRIFSETGRRIVPITFLSLDDQGNPLQETSTLEKARCYSNVVRYLSPKVVSIGESSSRLDLGPSDETIDEIGRTFDLVRQDRKRLAVFVAVSLALVALSGFATVFGWQAERSRRAVASQLASNFYTSSQIAAEGDEGLLEAFALAVKAAQQAPAGDNDLGLYLDRVMHLSTVMPNNVFNLPLLEGVHLASFNHELSRVALVTDNSRIRAFTLPAGEPLFVPEYVNRSGNASGVRPDFDGESIYTYINWYHPEPDPDEFRKYVLAAGWNSVSEALLTPVDDGQIDPDDLQWSLLQDDDLVEPDAKRKAPDSIRRLKGRMLPENRTGSNAAALATVRTDGTVLVWLVREEASFVTETSYGQKQWLDAAFVGTRLAVLDEDHLLALYDRQTKTEIWSLHLPDTHGFSLAPDDSVIVANNIVYRTHDGEQVGRIDDEDDDQYELLDDALTSDGTRVSAWVYHWEAGDDLSFQSSSPTRGEAVGQNSLSGLPWSTDPPPFEPRWSDFEGLLTDGRYGLAGSSGSFQVFDVLLQQPIASFYFGATTRLSEHYGEALLRRVAGIELRSEEGLEFRLKGGALLHAEPYDRVTRELRPVADGSPIVDPRDSQSRYDDQLVLSPNGRWLASVASDSLRIWDAATGFAVSERIWFDGKAHDIKFSSDSRRLEIATSRGTIQSIMVNFSWDRKPGWLHEMSEALAGISVGEDGEIVRFPIEVSMEHRERFLRRLGSASPDDAATGYLRAAFGEE